MISERTETTSFSPANVTPSGWQASNLRLHADGLLGNLDRISPEVRESRWLGGRDGDFDSLPLWLSGFVPTAWLLGDLEMQERAGLYIKKLLEKNKNGFIPKAKGEKFDIASLLVLLDALCVCAEASGNGEIDEAIFGALKELDAYTDRHALSARAQLHWAEALRPIGRELKKTNDPFLRRLAKKLACMGFDWLSFFDGWDYAHVAASELPDSFLTDVRNNIAAVKTAALLAEFYGDPAYADKAFDMILTLERFHGSAIGMICGDSRLGGKTVAHGIDTDALCEYMSALATLLKVSGSVECADRLEKLAYNAYPAAFAPDMWTHQRVQLVNQIQCVADGDHPFTTADGKAGLFGLCGGEDRSVAAFCKGYAAFVGVQFLKNDGGIYISGFSPAKLETVIDGANVKIEVSGEYPFRNTAKITVSVSAPVTFTLGVRIPCWTENMKIGSGSEILMPRKGEFFTFRGTWTDSTVFSLDTNDKFRLNRLPNDLYTVSRGALYYAIPVPAEKSYTEGNTYPYSEFELSASGGWNFALLVEDKDRFARSVTFEDKPLTSFPFSPATPAVEMFCCGKRIRWGIKNGEAVHNPLAVAASDKKEMLRLIPYGATDLRIAALPVITQLT